MKMFVNVSGVPLEPEKPRLDGRIVGGDPTTIQNHPWMVWPLYCCSVWRYFEVLEQKRPPVFVMTYLKWQNVLKIENNVPAVCISGCFIEWTEENYGFQVLFVNSSTQSQFHFTHAYYC